MNLNIDTERQFSDHDFQEGMEFLTKSAALHHKIHGTHSESTSNLAISENWKLRV